MTPAGSPEGHDGFCFTAGVRAAVMGVGTIHACLASRRQPPVVVAGISLGALNAAAMQRAYREIAGASGKDGAEQEAARWAWFREYLDTVSDEPFRMLWQAVPDQSDFFADMIPIRDTSVPAQFRDAETEARRQLYLKVKLGRWLAKLPISVRLVASAVVNYVRAVEKYPLPQRVISWTKLTMNGSWLAFLLVCRTAFAPQFFPEHEFRTGAERSKPARFGGIWHSLGWLNVFSATAAVAVLAAVLIHAVAVSPPVNAAAAWRDAWGWLLAIVVLIAVIRLTRPRQHIRNTRLARAIDQHPLTKAVYRLAATIPRLALMLLAYAYSFINLACLGVAAVAGALMLHAGAHREPAAPWATDALIIVLVLDFILSLGFALVALIPGTRTPLLAAGLCKEWPRPLFGWGAFLAAWINLLALTAAIGLGTFFIVVAWPDGGGLPAAVFLVEAVGLLAALPFVPLLVLIPAAVMWKRRKPIALARVGFRKYLAFGLAIVLAVGLFFLSNLVFAEPMRALRRLIQTNDPALPDAYRYWWHLLGFSAFVLMATWFAAIAIITQPPLRRWFGERVLSHVGLKQSLLPDLHLTLMLSRLFDPHHSRRGDPGRSPAPPVVDGGPGHPAAVIVAAPLQTLFENGDARPADQLWAGRGTAILDALRGALSVPPLFTPLRLKPAQFGRWLKRTIATDANTLAKCRKGIDLVDGSVIRQNPLPALFSYLRGHVDLAAGMAAATSRERPAIHVVYGVPIEEQPLDRNQAGVTNTIVDVGLSSLSLSQRRDTQLEVLQTKVIARLEGVAPGRDETSPSQALFADEIAPERDLTFDSTVNPSQGQILDGVAIGCRRTIETLHAAELARYAGPSEPDGRIACGTFLAAIGRTAVSSATPGLPEICARCTGHVRKPIAVPPEHSTASVETHLSEPEALWQEHPQLTGEHPRIVFIASGGVFRGAFHIGMLAALRLANAKPDLIVGASVGTLMGGALGRMFADPEADTLPSLVDLFLEVDSRVALTNRLKNAARELGIRGRSIDLSPGRIRRLVRRGGRGDAGFAVTGAPSALIDAISDLFLIPHRETSGIAAQFVAGHTAEAADRFLAQLRTETIRRLDIERAVIGTSLLEQVAADLLTGGRDDARLEYQPFQRAAQIGFYATATNLRTQSAVLLGSRRTAPQPDAPFDFVEAALASSAFPVVFAPRSESRIFPGTGRSDVLLADGGMFDNLPFLPAIEILSQCQVGYRRSARGRTRSRHEWLQRQLRQPDLLIAGALDPRPETDEQTGQTYRSIEAVRRRAGALKHNVKIRSFEKASRRIYGQLLRLQAVPPERLEDPRADFVDKVVNAGVLPVFPLSREHLNGTFSFCASTGLARARVQRSIADGCFQTLLALAQQQADADRAADLDRDKTRLTTRSIAALTADRRLARIRMSPRPGGGRGTCPFFQLDGRQLECPFAAPAARTDREMSHMRGVFNACRRDPGHLNPRTA
jgi:predicted acylesterase/phospholipase RssA